MHDMEPTTVSLARVLPLFCAREASGSAGLGRDRRGADQVPPTSCACVAGTGRVDIGVCSRASAAPASLGGLNATRPTTGAFVMRIRQPNRSLLATLGSSARWPRAGGPRQRQSPARRRALLLREHLWRGSGPDGDVLHDRAPPPSSPRAASRATSGRSTTTTARQFARRRGGPTVPCRGLTPDLATPHPGPSPNRESMLSGTRPITHSGMKTEERRLPDRTYDPCQEERQRGYQTGTSVPAGWHPDGEPNS